MKKVAILTINDDDNYGNRLQNYATQEILKNYNLKVETINNQIGIVGINVLKKKIKNFIKGIIRLEKYKRYNQFKKFNRKIRYSKYYIDKNHIYEKLNEKYDFFITGSDQVWNPTFGRMSDIDFLTFADKKKRNAFSASLGIHTIPKELREYYKENLLAMNNISVREEQAKIEIQELTGRQDIQVLIDPTMLLNSEQWNQVISKPKQLKTDKYILNYFLGEISTDRRKEIERIAKENDCEIINILDRSNPFYQTGPSEFLYLEKNAFLICTDSFHSCVFAILYNKPFIVFDRADTLESMNSRIETLLLKFKLENRKYKGKIETAMLQNNYEICYKILEQERKKAQCFLKRVFNT